MKNSKFFVLLAIILMLGIALGACAIHTDMVENPFNGEGGSDIAVENDFSEEKPTEAEPQTKFEVIKSSKYSVDDKLVALTFDDGPRNKTTNRILDILEKNEGAATFFIVGYNIDSNVDVLKRAVSLGCEIGNHSDGHKKLTDCTPEEIREQVDKPIEKIKSLIGYEMKLFRAPGGNFKGVEETIGKPIIQWSIDTEDWKHKDAANKDRTPEQREKEINEIVDHVLSNVKKGDIILMHDIYDFTADLCEVLIPKLVEKGFKLATVSEMYQAYGTELKDGKVYRSYKFPSAESDIPALPMGAYIVETGGSPLNIREKANVNSDQIGKVYNGTVILVKKSVPGWSYVTFNSVSGWVSSKYLLKF